MNPHILMVVNIMFNLRFILMYSMFSMFAFFYLPDAVEHGYLLIQYLYIHFIANLSFILKSSM